MITVKVSKTRTFAIVLMWVMAIYYFGVISAFSAQVANASSKESSRIVTALMDILSRVWTFRDYDTAFSNLQFIVRKLAHFTNFFILGFLYCMLANTLCSEEKLVFSAVCAALICGLCAAALDELHQYFVPGRSAEVRDVCIDFSGVSLGCIIFTLLRIIFTRKFFSH